MDHVTTGYVRFNLISEIKYCFQCCVRKTLSLFERLIVGTHVGKWTHLCREEIGPCGAHLLMQRFKIQPEHFFKWRCLQEEKKWAAICFKKLGGATKEVLQKLSLLLVLSLSMIDSDTKVSTVVVNRKEVFSLFVCLQYLEPTTSCS